MHEYPLITLIAAAFTAAWVLGIITQNLRLSPIVGYLLAGVAIGPFTPGFVGDVKLAPQLAEMGVILLMFGVGLHFHLKDLMAVRRVAVPGAFGQTLAASILGLVVAMSFGLGAKTGLVLGMSMAVASTVVLIRGLSDNNLLSTSHGHVAVGWLIVEDILTVVLLVLIPALGTPIAADPAHGAAVATSDPIWKTMLIALGKLALLTVVLLVVGGKVIPWLMVQVARLRSRELFTLTVLVMAIAIAAASYQLFGASMALGAFLAGMVVGQSPVSHQAAADALPLRDAFAVLFFAAVGMLFDPKFLVQEPLLVLAGLFIVMVGKPLAALLIVGALRYPLKTGLTVAFGLAQIGEFSFILSDMARAHNLMDNTGHNLIVACAIISITANPFLYRLINPSEKFLGARFPRLHAYLNRGAEAQARPNEHAEKLVEKSTGRKPLAVVVGYGPVGRTVDAILRQSDVDTIVVDINMDTIQTLTDQDRPAIYGDGGNMEVVGEALRKATHVVVTLPHSADRAPLIASAKRINPDIKVIVRARYISEGDQLAQVGADYACFEEAEAAAALARVVLAEQGADEDTIRRESARIRRELVSDYF